MNADPALLELLTETLHTLRNGNRLAVVLIDELRALRSDLGERRTATAPRDLSKADRLHLEALLPAIVQTSATERVTVNALTAAARGRTRSAKALRTAINESGLNAMQIGRLLKRASEADAAVAGFHVDRCGDSRAGAVFAFISATAKEREDRDPLNIAASFRETRTT